MSESVRIATELIAKFARIVASADAVAVVLAEFALASVAEPFVTVQFTN